MSAIVTLELPFHTHIVVSPGDRIDTGTIIAQTHTVSSPDYVNLSDLLSVSPSSISKYLVKSIGDTVRRGDIVGKRRKLFSEYLVRSPIDGIIASMDLIQGTIAIVPSAQDSSIKSPFASIVKQVDNNHISLEVQGDVISGTSGRGVAHGTICLINGENDIHKTASLAKSIAVMLTASEVVFAKLRALGTAGVVVSQEIEEAELPFISVAASDIHHFKKHHGKQAILDGDQRFIIINA